MPTKSNNTGGRGGARPGSGRKKKALTEKVEAGNPGGRALKVLDIPDVNGVDMPKPHDFLSATQRDGGQLQAKEIYEEGYLQTTEGNVVHYGYIEKFIEELGKRYNIREIAFDRWGAVQMVQNLEGMGFTVVPFGQGFKDMSPPTKELMKLVLEQKIAHGGHPVLRWMMDNIFIRSDPAGNIKADKAKSTEKIDGAVATIMALDRAIRCGNDTGESVYDSRGILFL